MPIKEQVIKKSALSPTVLIAGGAGFIGSHLAHALLQRDARVIVLDNFTTGKDVYVNNLVKNPKFAFFDTDINKGIPKNIESVDYIVHLASVESYLYSRDEVNLDSLLTNAFGTKNLLDLANKSEAKFLLVSSIDVYQGHLSPADIDSYFGKTEEEEKKYSLSEAKRFAEALVWEFYKNHQTDVRIIRLPEVYGPRMNLASSGNLGRLAKDLLENGNLDVYGEGTEKEYYLYISDVISGLIKALLNKSTKGKIFTLAPEEPHAVLEIAYLLKSLADREIQVNFKRSEKKVLSSRIPDRGDLRVLKWEPKISFKQGLIKTLEWFGYETNEHSFKPNHLIEKKREEVASKNGALITSLVDVKAKVAETLPKIQLARGAKGIVESPKAKRLKKKFKWPKLELPSFKKSALPKPQPISGMPNPVKSRKQQIIVSVSAVVVAVFVLIFMPLIQTTINSRTGIRKLQTVPEYLAKMEPESAKDTANSAFQNFYKSQKSLNRSEWLFNVIGRKAMFDSSASLLSSATHFSRGTYYISKASLPFSQIWETMKPNSNLIFNEESFSEAEVNLNEAKSSLQQALAEYKRVDINALPSNIMNQAEEYGTMLNTLIKSVDTASILAADIPNLLGSGNDQKRYLVLFQNSNELRPTGGFIGSYAIVEIENGKITTLTIDDIYNPDGQIDVRNIQVPPSALGELLNEDRAYIRNANWNPDFPSSVKEIKDLYFRVTGKEVDGVAAVDLFFAENILNVTGPIFLTAFGEEITSDNLYERTQFHSDFNYESGSSQKRAFLTIFGGKLLESIFALPNEKMPELLTQINKAFSEKHLILSLSNSTFASELEKNNWDGSVVKRATGDYLYVVNSNVGGTKSNYYVNNSMEFTVTSQTRDGLLRGILALKYTHTQKDNAWPGGPYKDYVRVLTQNGSNLTGATIAVNGETTDILEGIIIDKVKGYNSFETLLELKPQETAVLTFYYDLPQNLSITAENRKYNLYWQKQPGTKGDDVVFRFDPPFGLAVNGSNRVTTETELDTDKVFSLQLQ